jgi:hydroxypyruvate isomerase
MLWPELSPVDRFAAAETAGFQLVEMLFPHELDGEVVAGLLDRHHLRMILFDPAAGDWAAGERGFLGVPGREAEFLSSVEAAMALAARLGTRRLNVLAGVVPAGVSRDAALATAAANLRLVAPLFESRGLQLLIEAINPIDVPGYLIDDFGLAADLVYSAGSDAIRLQLDQYHVAMVGQDPIVAFDRYAERIAHVQIADLPGRHQPGTGSYPIGRFLKHLDAVGYAGVVGLEYRPDGPTDASLAWLPVADRR